MRLTTYKIDWRRRIVEIDRLLKVVGRRIRIHAVFRLADESSAIRVVTSERLEQRDITKLLEDIDMITTSNTSGDDTSITWSHGSSSDRCAEGCEAMNCLKLSEPVETDNARLSLASLYMILGLDCDADVGRLVRKLYKETKFKSVVVLRDSLERNKFKGTVVIAVDEKIEDNKLKELEDKFIEFYRTGVRGMIVHNSHGVVFRNCGGFRPIIKTNK